MAHRTCAICNIREITLTGKQLFFGKFPKNENICKQWLKFVGNEELVYLPIEKLSEIRFICGDHFSRKDFNKKGNRLKKHAVPKLNLTRPPLTDIQLLDFPQHIFSKNEQIPTTSRERQLIPNKSQERPIPSMSQERPIPSMSQERQDLSSKSYDTGSIQETIPCTSQERQSIPRELKATEVGTKNYARSEENEERKDTQLPCEEERHQKRRIFLYL